MNEEDGEGGGSSSEEDSSDSEEESTTGKAGKSMKRPRQIKPLAGADMYKVFDGSALMTIGTHGHRHIIHCN